LPPKARAELKKEVIRYAAAGVSNRKIRQYLGLSMRIIATWKRKHRNLGKKFFEQDLRKNNGKKKD